jgi:hypothetical protein
MTDSYIQLANIQRFQTLLQGCTDETLRRTLETLLTEERKKLAPKLEGEGSSSTIERPAGGSTLP